MAAQLICLRHAEAEPVAQRLLGKRPQKVFVSEALRSRQTGEIIASYLGAQIAVVPALAEVSMGSGDREPRKPGLAADVLRQWIVCGNLSVRLMDGELGHEVALRMKRALNEIGAQCHDSLAIVVGHVASLTVGVDALCRNGPTLWGKPLPHATPFVLTVSGEGWHVQWPDPWQKSVIL